MKDFNIFSKLSLFRFHVSGVYCFNFSFSFCVIFIMLTEEKLPQRLCMFLLLNFTCFSHSVVYQ